MRRTSCAAPIRSWTWAPAPARSAAKSFFQGSFDEILKDADSLTGAYPQRTSGDFGAGGATPGGGGARHHGRERPAAQPETAGRPLPARHDYVRHRRQRLGQVDRSCTTRSTPGLRRLKGQHDGDVRLGAHDAIHGHYEVDAVEMVDQSPIGRTSRSNPVTYIKAFDGIRALLADTYQARIRGYKPGYFSFNVPGGRCEVCQGEGVVQIEMQFLADLYLECEACKGQRYKQDVLEVRYKTARTWRTCWR